MLRYQEFLADAHHAGEPAFAMKDFLACYRQRFSLPWEKIGAQNQQKIFATYLTWWRLTGEQRAENTRIMATLRDALRMVIDALATHGIFLQLDQEVTDVVAWGALKDAYVQNGGTRQDIPVLIDKIIELIKETRGLGDSGNPAPKGT